MKQHQPNEIKLIQSLQNRENRAFSEAYIKYQSYFSKWAKKQFPGMGAEKIEDIFQNALIVFIEKFIWTGRIRVENGTIKGLTASITSFLTTIGRNMILTEIKREKRIPITALIDRHQKIGSEEATDREEKTDQLKVVGEAFEMLKEKEKEVIYFKYVMGHSYEEIRVMMELKSADSLKTLCARYMKKFRTNYQRIKKNKEIMA